MKLLPDWIRKKPRHNPLDDLYHSQFQKIFLASKVNGAPYTEPPQQRISLPKGTWLQKKMERRDG